MHLLKDSIRIFTDGSKLKVGVGTGIYLESIIIAEFIRLSDYCSAFQAEMLAVKAKHHCSVR